MNFLMYTNMFKLSKLCFVGLCLIQSVSPPSGSLVANFEGELNATAFSCSVTSGLNQITTEWSIQNFRGVDSPRPITFDLAPELFLFTGDQIPSDPIITFSNVLVVRNYTFELDGVVLYCGTGRDPQQANFTLRVYRTLVYAKYSSIMNY